MVKQEKLNDLAARTMCTDDIKKGRSQIEAVLGVLRRRAKRLEWASWAIGSVGLAFTVWGILLIHRAPSMFEWLMCIGCIFLCIGYYRTRIFQKPRKFLTQGRPYSIDLPPELEQLLASLASGELHAQLSVKSGIAHPGATWTSGEEISDSLLGREVFSNRYAPLLLSENPEIYDYVHMRVPLNKIVDGPIYVISEETSDDAGLIAAKIKLAADRIMESADRHELATSKQFANNDQQTANNSQSELILAKLTQAADRHELATGDQATNNEQQATNNEQHARNNVQHAVNNTQNEQNSAQLARAAEQLTEKSIQNAPTFPQLVHEELWEADTESENLNTDDSDWWLVGGTLEEFERGLNDFLKGKASDKKKKWLRDVLKIARYEMRKGRNTVSPTDAIKTIRAELLHKYGTLTMPGGKTDSIETIRALMRGWYAGNEIREHFLSRYKERPVSPKQ